VQRDDGGVQETKQYFLHKDLQGSTNIVTDQVGDTFQHHEYFPTGEVWVDEKSTIFRTQYQYAGGYADDVRRIIDFGSRWYDQDREMFYSPDPVLVDDPTAILTAPALRSAYSYAGANPLTFVDPGGRQFTKAQAKSFIKGNEKAIRNIIRNDPQLRAKLAANLETKLPRSLVRLGLDIDKAESRQNTFAAIDDFFVPLLDVNVSTGEVKLGLFVQPLQKTVRKASDDANSGSTANATGPGAGPNAPNQTAPQASANVSPAAQNAPNTDAPGANPPGAGGSGAAPPSQRHTPPNKPLPPTPVKGDV
jgi:RHS repeat-associated protein